MIKKMLNKPILISSLAAFALIFFFNNCSEDKNKSLNENTDLSLNALDGTFYAGEAFFVPNENSAINSSASSGDPLGSCSFSVNRAGINYTINPTSKSNCSKSCAQNSDLFSGISHSCSFSSVSIVNYSRSFYESLCTVDIGSQQMAFNNSDMNSCVKMCKIYVSENESKDIACHFGSKLIFLIDGNLLKKIGSCNISGALNTSTIDLTNSYQEQCDNVCDYAKTIDASLSCAFTEFVTQPVVL